MSTSTFNIVDDSIHIDLDCTGKLPKVQWDYMQSTFKFRWFPGSHQFVAKWSPATEDYVVESFGEIEEEHQADDAESRVNRYLGYSTHAAERSEQAREYSDSLTDGIPMGQPILVGHHSEKAHRNTLKKSNDAMRRSIDEAEKAAYWQSRADGAIRRAAQKENPNVIYRRIHGPEGIEKHIRDHTKGIATAQTWLKVWKAGEDYAPTQEQAMAIANVDHVNYPDCCSLWHALETGKVTPDKARERAIEAHNNSIVWHQRWLDHYQMLLDYNQALYVASGGIQADVVKPEVGGGVRCWVNRSQGGFTKIVKVNRKTLTVMDNWGNGGADFRRNVDIDDCKAILTKAEFEQWQADGILPERYQKVAA